MKNTVLMAMVGILLFAGGCAQSTREEANEPPRVPLPSSAQPEPSLTPEEHTVAAGEGMPLHGASPEPEVDGEVAARQMMQETGVEFSAPEGFENKNAVRGNLSFKAKDAETFVVVRVDEKRNPDATNRQSVDELVKIKAPFKMIAEPKSEKRSGLSINTFEMGMPNGAYQHKQVAVSNGSGKVLVIWAHGNLNNAENAKAVNSMIEGLKKR